MMKEREQRRSGCLFRTQSELKPKGNETTNTFLLIAITLLLSGIFLHSHSTRTLRNLDYFC